MSSRLISRITGLILGAVAAFFISSAYNTTPDLKVAHHPALDVIIGITVAAAVLAFIIAPYVSIMPYRWVRHQIRHAAVSDLIAGAVGLIVGLVIAALVNIFLSQVRFWQIGQWAPILAAIAIAYVGMATAILRKDDFARLGAAMFQAGRNSRRPRDERESDESDEREGDEPMRLRDRLSVRRGGRTEPRAELKILLDTSAIIDGRIADISETGFIMGTLVAPRFVLEELQHIADSSDSMRRARGRRGLDILQRLQKDTRVPVEITDADPEEIHEVDAKLVKLARQWHCPIITNDFNLNRVAELQGVKVLNINELSHAVKPIMLPGEELSIKIMQEGKEYGQGVGYLDDGTMIVVEGGKSFIGSAVTVSVTRVLQTVAGRMIFAQPKQQTASNPAPVRRVGAS